MCSFLCLFIITLVTLYVALMYESLAIMLFVYVEAVWFVLSLVILLYRKYTLRGSIDVPINISEAGKENLVKIHVTNKSRIPIMRLKAKVTVEDKLSGMRKKSWLRLAEALNGDNEYVRSLIFPGAGNYEVSIKKLRVYDFTGFLYVNLKLKSTDRVQVMPKLYDVPVRLTLATKNFYGEADVYDEHTPGHDRSELFQVREYHKGDRIQSIHWKMTAKQDEIMVKEHSLPKSCPVILFLEYSPNRKIKKRALNYFEAAVSISYSLMDAGCPHYVVWYDSADSDIKRVRVDDEESLFYVMGLLMNVKWEHYEEDIVLRYEDKFRHEPYVWALTLDENLQIRKNGELYAALLDDDLEKSLSGIELLL